ncbi:MAG TPA: Holliday junction resolvase RuvX [Dysgonamonadaceae bacterium]|nr:Holliday junction resolvase RuvX [Dysgonamonadaceae bacterium]
MARLLAIDFGKKRTGIAVSDSLQLIANGLKTVRSHEALDFLKRYVQKESVERIIIGMPRQMNYEESESMQYIKPFVKRLQKELPDIPVEYFDERFTSSMAFQTMIDGGVKKKKRQNKALVDEISATIILQGYMESQRMSMR